MYDIENLKNEIVERLQGIDPEQIVLFGSYAHGRPGLDSDIDLYVVTKDKFIPQNYKEKRELVRRVSRPLNELRQKISIDLVVHTHAMNEKFYSLNSSFARELQERGIRVL
mgnify:CR=1 FL=1